MSQLISWRCHRDVPREEWEGLDYSAKFTVMQELAAELQVKIAESPLRNDLNQGKVAGLPCWTIFSMPWTDPPAPALVRIEVQIPVNTESPPSSDVKRDE